MTEKNLSCFQQIIHTLSNSGFVFIAMGSIEYTKTLNCILLVRAQYYSFCKRSTINNFKSRAFWPCRSIRFAASQFISVILQKTWQSNLVYYIQYLKQTVAVAFWSIGFLLMCMDPGPSNLSNFNKVNFSFVTKQFRNLVYRL